MDMCITTFVPDLGQNQENTQTLRPRKEECGEWMLIIRPLGVLETTDGMLCQLSFQEATSS